MGELSDSAFFLTCLSYQLIKSVLKSFLINRPVWLAGRLSDSVGIFRLVLDDKIMVGKAHPSLITGITQIPQITTLPRRHRRWI